MKHFVDEINSGPKVGQSPSSELVLFYYFRNFPSPFEPLNSKPKSCRRLWMEASRADTFSMELRLQE